MRSLLFSPDFVTYINRHLRTAGWHAVQMRAGVEIQTKGEADNFVTQADKEIDVMMSAALARLLPGCAVLNSDNTLTDGLITEESVDNLPPAVARAIASRPHVWYFDALDGTDNYVKEDGQYSILLGLVVDGEPVYGWVYAPARDELYFGGPLSEVAANFGYEVLWRQRGNGAPEQVGSTAPEVGPSGGVLKGRLRVIMGSRDQNAHPEVVERIRADEWVPVGSLGLKLIAIITGAADVYVHPSQKLKFWDTAAPLALARAAGFTVCDFEGAPIQFTPHLEGTGEDMFRHRQTVLIGTAAGVATTRKRLHAR